PNSLKLTASLIDTLERRADLCVEGRAGGRRDGGVKTPASAPKSPFPSTPPRAPSSLKRAAEARPTTLSKAAAKPAIVAATPPSVTVQGLVIQIVPHHNGEVFLSKKALDQ